MDKRISAEVPGDALGDEFKGYVFKITGGNDKQGFPMKQGVLTPGRVRLLFSAGHSCYRPRRTGERKRKSIRGCIVSNDLSVLSRVIVTKGENELPGLTDTDKPSRLGPKRASKIRKLFVRAAPFHALSFQDALRCREGGGSSRMITPYSNSYPCLNTLVLRHTCLRGLARRPWCRGRCGD